jgi:hypothetical protein
MGCTEIPLGMSRLRLPATLLDPAKLLARALVRAVAPDVLKSEGAPEGLAKAPGRDIPIPA